MSGSIDCEDFFPDFALSKEIKAIPLECWQYICLSDIWIPSSLLPNRKKSSNTRVTQGIFHTLKKRGHAQCIESFSVYSDSDVFLSDSEEDAFDLDSFSSEQSKRTENSQEVIGKTGSFSKLRSFSSLNNLSNIGKEDIKFAGSFEKLMNNKLNKFKPNNLSNESYTKEENINQIDPLKLIDNSIEADRKSEYSDKIINTDKTQTLNNDDKILESHISLHDILDTTMEVDMRNFAFKKENKYSDIHVEKSHLNKKRNKKDKRKNKVTLDQFLEGYNNENRQEDYANDYLQKVLMSQNGNSKVQVKSVVEFPDLISKELQFIHSKTSEMSIKGLTGILTKSEDVGKNQNVENDLEESSTTERANSIGKIVIENIPAEVSHEEIYSVLTDYGVIKDFCLEHDGDFLKVIVEFDLIKEMDWVIECVNGTELFGASSKVLKCYKKY